MTERQTFNMYDPNTGELRVVFQAGSHGEMVRTAKQLDPTGRLVFQRPTPVDIIRQRLDKLAAARLGY